MGEDVALGVPLGRLLTTDERQGLGEKVFQKAGIEEKLKSQCASGMCDDEREFIANSFGGHLI